MPTDAIPQADPSPPPKRRGASRRPATSTIGDFVEPETVRHLAEERRWALELEPDHLFGVSAEIRMLRQALRDAFAVGDDAAVRQDAEALRRLLRERALVPEVEDDAEGALEDGLSADLRRVLQRVGVEMGVDA